MAKNKDTSIIDKNKGTKGKKEDFDLDFDFDFDDELTDSIDLDIEDNINSSANKGGKREAVLDTFKGAISGAKDVIFSNENIRTFTETALPDEYSAIFNTAESIGTSLSKVKENASKELKPIVGRLTKTLDKMVKSDESRTKKISDKLKSMFSIYESDRVSEAKQQEDSITSSLNEIFGKTIEAQATISAQTEARREAKERLDDQVELKKFNSQYSALTSIAQSTSILTQYQHSVTFNYQKKSLELQYRSYFILADLLNKSKEHFTKTNAHLENVVKNTGLPEFVKLQQKERFVEMARNKLFDKAQSRLFKGDQVDRAITAIGKSVTENVSDVFSAFVEGFEGLQEGIETSSEFGSSPYELGGSIAADVLLTDPSERWSKKLGAKLREKIKDVDWINKFGKKYYGYAKNPEGLMYDINRKLDDSGGNFFIDMIKDALSDYTKDKHGMSIENIGSRSDLTKMDIGFDRRFYTSVTDIIPGYLARILAQTETTAINTSKGKKTHVPEIQRYDYTTNKFLRERDLKKSLDSRLVQIGTSRGAIKEVDAFIKQVGLDKLLTEEEQRDLSAAIMKWILDGNPLALLATSDPKFRQLIPFKNKVNIIKALKTMEARSERLTGDELKTSVKSTFDVAGVNIKDKMVNLYPEIQKIYTEGHGDLLESSDLVKRKDDALSINKDKYVEYMMDDRVKSDIHSKKGMKKFGNVKSDIHAKEGLKKLPNSSILSQLTGITNYLWNYKEGEGSSGTKIGPTAQSIYSQFGKYAAPGGTSIDLVSMNGLTIEAIKELNEKVDSSFNLGSNSGTAFDVLKRIDENTLRTAVAIEGLDNKFFLGLKFDGSNVSEKLGIFARLFKDKIEEGTGFVLDKTADIAGKFTDKATSLSRYLFNFAQTKSETISGSLARLTAGLLGGASLLVEKTLSGVMAASEYTGEKIVFPIYDYVSTKIKKSDTSKLGAKLKEGASNLLTGAWSLATKIYDKASTLVTKQIPDAIRGGFNIAKKLGKEGLEIFDPPKDIYVIGETEPRLKAQVMRMNGYIDVNTGKVITRPGMITGPVSLTNGDIVLSSEDISKGIVDNEGNEISSIRAKVIGFLRTKAIEGANRAKKVFDFILGKASNIGSNIINRIPSFGRSINDCACNILLDIRDILYSGFKDKLPRKFKFRKLEKPSKTSDGSTKQSIDKKTTDGGNVDVLNDWKEKVSQHAKKGINKVNEMRDSLFDRIMFGSKRRTPNITKGIDSIINKKYGITEYEELMSKYFRQKTRTGEEKSNWKKRIDDLREKASEYTRTGINKAAEIRDSLIDESKYRKGNALDTMWSMGSKVKDAIFGVKEKAVDAIENVSKKIDKDKNGDDYKKLMSKYFKQKEEEKEEKEKPRWKKRIDDLKERAEEHRKRVQEKLTIKNADPRYRGKNAIDFLMEKANAAKNAILDFFDAGSSIGDMLGGGRGRRRGGGRRGGGVKGAAKKGIIRAGIGRGVAAGAAVLKTGVAVGKFAIPKIAALGGIAGAGLAKLGAGAISALAGTPLLPFIAGAAAIGAVGYGLYKLHQYMKHKPTKIDHIRLLQYGLNDSLKHHHNKIMAFEKMVRDKALVLDGGNIKVDASKLDWEEVSKLFKIKPETDKGMAQMKNLYDWVYGRFIPVFITNREALYDIDPKLDIHEYSKLTGVQLKAYLGSCDVPSEIYSIDISPFPDVDKLPDTKNEAEVLIKEFTDKASKNIKEPKLIIPSKANTSVNNQKKIQDAVDQAKETQNKFNQDVLSTNPRISELYRSPTSPDIESPPSVTVPMGNTVAPQKPRVLNTPMISGDRADNYMVLNGKVNVNQLHPLVLERFRGMVQEYGEMTGKSVVVTDGKRSREEQELLYRRNPQKAAKPGTSLHETGFAIDVDRRALNEMEELGLMRKYGFTRPVGGEPWHAEPAGIQANISKARSDPGYAEEMINMSMYRGGGGYGAVPGSELGRRNPKLAYETFIGAGTNVDEASVERRASNLIDLNERRMIHHKQTEVTENKPRGVEFGTLSMVQQEAANDSKIQTQHIARAEAIPMNPKVNRPESNDVASIRQMIREVAHATNTNPETMEVIAAVESDFRPTARAQTSSAGGLYQFTDSTWSYMLRKYGAKHKLSPNASKFDPVANALMAAEYIKENEKNIRGVVDRPSADVVYTSHFLGPNGAKTLFRSDPNKPANVVLPAAANSNRSIFYNAGRPKTVSEVKQTIESKLADKAHRYNINLPLTSKSTEQSSPLLSSAIQSKPSEARKTVQADSSRVPARIQPTPIAVPMGGISTPNTISAVSTMPANIPAAEMVSVLNKSYDVQNKMLSTLVDIANKVTIISEKKSTEIVQPQPTVPDSKQNKPDQKPRFKMTGATEVPELPISLKRSAA